MAKPKAKKTKRREKKNVLHGQAHIKSTFNNTIVTITDLQGNTLVLGERRQRRLQGLAQVDAVRRAARRREGRARRAGARPAEGRRVREGPGFGPRDGDPLPGRGRARGRRDPRRDAGAAQRLPATEAPPRLTRADPGRTPAARDTQEAGSIG